MPDATHPDLAEAIAREEARLAELEKATEQAKRRLGLLREQQRSASCSRPASPGGSANEMTSTEKISLFRSLFRGRTDVFPKLWVNAKTAKKGYAPACANEWVRGVCDKPRVKCGECPNQAFIAVDDRVVLDHLQGRHVIGVYPMLDNETCWFLAADFDKSSWQDDVGAFADTAQSLDVHVAIERSRSGNGAHAWMFFASAVAASTARKVGCFLITRTMERRHQLSMESYDRFFPNQDTMPRGGFGSLIALPLQHGPRQQGNTVFVDRRFEPQADQWAYLASVGRLRPDVVEEIAMDAVRGGKVVGVRFGDPDDNPDARTPWMRQPSRRPRAAKITGPLPAQVHAMIAQRLFVEKKGLPAALINEMKRLAAFQNPEFNKKQSMRLSTAMTPRVIACAEDLPEHVGLPRGCQDDLEALLRENGVALQVEDGRQFGEPIEHAFTGTLTPLQLQAAQALLSHDIGVFVAPPGVGKTVVGTYLIAKRARTTLVLVHRRPLLDQWVTQLALFLGIDTKEIGQIGGGKRKPNGKLDVAMIQSLLRDGDVDDLVASYGHVVVDECHHLPAVSFEKVLAEAKARYVTGLTATPQRRDGHHPILDMQLGPVRFAVDAKAQAARRPFEHRLIVRETSFGAAALGGEHGIQQLYGALASDSRRNDLILNDVIAALEERRSPILLTERNDHIDLFAERLRGFARHLIVLRGGMTAKERRDLTSRLATIPDDEERLLLATGRYIGEGFDDARLDTLFLALPVSWKGTLMQYTGRLHRLHRAKREVRIYEYVDRAVPMLLRMFEKRLRGYRAIGYAHGEAPFGFAEADDRRFVELDPDALRAVDGDAI
jgi:superfamily II DNA or RNA helicase